MEKINNQPDKDLRTETELEMQGYREYLEFQEWKRTREHIIEADRFIADSAYKPGQPKISDLDALNHCMGYFAIQKNNLERKRAGFQKAIEEVDLVIDAIRNEIFDFKELPF